VPAGTYTAGTLVGVVDVLGGPLVMSPLPMKHDVYSCGPILKVLRYYRATELPLTQKFNRRITGIQYDASIYDDDPGTVAAATDRLPSRKLHPNQVAALVAREYSQKSAVGAYGSKLYLGWQSDRDEPCDVYIRRVDLA
jgi:hypothetical protein